MFRAGLYARVSTDDQQTLPMQCRAMREYAARRDWAIAVQVREIGSGAVKRQAREKLLEAARRREIDVVLVWRLDRWGRIKERIHYWILLAQLNPIPVATGAGLLLLLLGLFLFQRRRAKSTGRVRPSKKPAKAATMNGDIASVRQVAESEGVDAPAANPLVR